MTNGSDPSLDTSLTLYHSANADRVPIEDMYAARYAFEEQRAYERMTLEQPHVPLEAERLIAPVAPATPAVTPEGVPVDLTPEALQSSAEAAAKLPQARANALRAIDEVKPQPVLRGAINKMLGALTGGVLTLDAIDEHLRAEIEGRPSALAEKLKSPEVLKLLDPVGNTAEALVRAAAQREGIAPEITDKVAPMVGMLASVLTPMGVGSAAKGAKVTRDVFMNSLFSNPATHIANIASNALTATWAIPERFLSAAWSAAEYGLTLGAHERTVFFGESGAQLIGALSATVDAIRAAVHTLRTGESVLPSIMQDVAAAAPTAERPLF